MKKFRITLLTLFLLSPLNVFAYSSKIIVGGENIGINIKNNGILVVGFYKVDGSLIKSNPTIKVGDAIIKVSNNEVNSINELTTAIENNITDNQVEITIKRENKEVDVVLDLKEKDGVYKTGLYVKDSISGIGTLTYIDPETKIFGSLGHEIIESNSNQKIEVKTGEIFDSIVTGITKSVDGTPGEKQAKLNSSTIFGTITKNTSVGLFGNYTNNLPGKKLVEVAENDEIKVGKATILTVLNDDEIKEYEINITKINEYNKIKNIYFEVTDKELLETTGGIVQGMSGSPILQNNKIIGAVTHVIVDNVKTGYGIFITTMLKEGEKN
jgi:stage IV sporulation protein B